MSFQNVKTDRYCVAGRRRSATKYIYVDITSNGSKVLVGYCSISSCNRKKSRTVFDNTIQAEGVGDSFKNLGKKISMYQERWQGTY